MPGARQPGGRGWDRGRRNGEDGPSSTRDDGAATARRGGQAVVCISAAHARLKSPISPPLPGTLARRVRRRRRKGPFVNRQYKRMMKREEQRKAATPRPQPRAAGAATRSERTKPRDFIREVGAELRKVAWPTRQEVAAYSVVVLVSVIVIAAIIFVMDFVFTKAVLALFGVET